MNRDDRNRLNGFPCVASSVTRLKPGVNESAKGSMHLESIIGLAASVLLLIYLAYALLRPEKF